MTVNKIIINSITCYSMNTKGQIDDRFRGFAFG